MVNIEENMGANKALLFVSTKDSDMFSAGTVDLELHGDSKFFEYDLGFIWLSQELDRESQNQLTLSVFICDQGQCSYC